MAKQKQPNPAEETLHEIEESFDRVAAWVQRNKTPLLIVVGVILVASLGFDRYGAWQTGREERGAAAFAEVGEAFLSSMGARPGAIDFQEPANPETARAVREEYVTQFLAMANEHEGTAASVQAYLEAGNIHEALGAPHLALDAWQAGADSVGSGSALRGLMLSRIAEAHEDGGEWVQAAENHEAAGRITGYPARYSALGAAARCWAEADQPDRAVAIFDEIQEAGQDAKLPVYTASRLRELKAQRQP